MGDLAGHQAGLEQHFRELADQRAGGRVFALEHGMGVAQRSEIQTQLNTYCTTRPPSEEHWLVWTAYAAEIGYEYAGREYWQTFERQTQGWRRYYDSRQWIRECFRRFATTFAGFTPAGPWAEHFSIICWPIVHAVLPKDLQARIARILYDVRRSFSPSTLGDPSALGALIATRGWLGTTRLEQLADDVEVIGSIALALLFREREHSGLPLLATTVDRIAEDLAKHRHAREWLHDARSAASHISLKGLRSPKATTPGAPAKPATAEQARTMLEELGVHPAVQLAPSPEGWLVMLALPNLSPLLRRFPELRDYLANARPTIAGSSGMPLARQQVLQGNERVRLYKWPNPTDVLLVFEKSPELLRVVLSAECLLRPGPVWVFRVASDRMGHELRGRAVRPGQEYVLITTELLADGDPNLVPDKLGCDGVFAYRLRVPQLIGDAYIEALRALNLSVARSVQVRPAGLAAAGWDGNGYGEWLAGERPCLAVSADHDTKRMSCRLSGSPELVVAGRLLNAETPVFVEFPELSVGAHIATFELEAVDGSVDHGEIELLVRDRRPWAPGLTHDGALTVIIDPPAPTLEDLWSDRASIDLHGPAGHRVECGVRFWSRPGRLERYKKQLLPSLTLPVSRRQWAALFRTSCRLQEEAQNAYDQSDGVTLDFVVPGVGRFELSAEREFAPLRWIASYKNHHYSLRLQDDRGVADTPQIVHYAFETPAVAEVLAAREFTGEGVEVERGLYVALAGGQSTAIIVAPRKFQLQGLTPRVAPIDSSVDAILQGLNTVELWSRARQVGSAFSLRFAVPSLGALVNALYGALTDRAWATLESGSRQQLRQAIGHDGLGRELSDDTAEYARMEPLQRVERFERTLTRELGTSGVRRPIDDPRKRLAEVALRFASDPGGMRAWAETNERLRGMINLLVHSKVATRAARYLVLGTAQHLAQGHPSEQMLYPGWEW